MFSVICSLPWVVVSINEHLFSVGPRPHLKENVILHIPERCDGIIYMQMHHQGGWGTHLYYGAVVLSDRLWPSACGLSWKLLGGEKV